MYAGDSNVIPVGKTGQTESFRTHDDGDLQKGMAWPIPRFTGNNNGTVTDNLTGVIWLKNAYCSGTMEHWNTVIDYAAALYDGCTNCFGTEGDCGLSDGSSAGDWRLPNRNEVLSLIITPAIKYVTDVIPAKAGIQKDTGCRIMSGMTGFGYLVAGLIIFAFSIPPAIYWSSSTNKGRAGFAWGVDLGNGNVVRHDKSSEMHVWCVRDGN